MSQSSLSLPRRLRFATAIVLSAFAAAGSAWAGTYIVTLNSGATFESRYKPKQASWDSSKILVLSDVGNWLSLRRSDIASVKSTSENRGLGFVIDNTTIALGWAPNDNLTPEQEAEMAAAAARNPQAFQQQQPNYSVNQFVEPNATQGLPPNLLGGSTGGYSGGYPGGTFMSAPSAPAPNPTPAVVEPQGQ